MIWVTYIDTVFSIGNGIVTTSSHCFQYVKNLGQIKLE